MLSESESMMKELRYLYTEHAAGRKPMARNQQAAKALLKRAYVAQRPGMSGREYAVTESGLRRIKKDREERVGRLADLATRLIERAGGGSV